MVSETIDASIEYGPGPFADWAIAAAPPPALTISEWADRFRYLPQSSAANGARWRTDDVPYLRGIMDALLEPTTRKLALEKAAQVAGTEAVNNTIGYFIHYDPCPILLVQPSESVAEEYSKERLSDMIRSTPELQAVVGNKRQTDGEESTLLYKWFPGGFLALGGANSPNTYARRAARLVIADDFDRFPAVVGDEGDPADLLGKRTTTFDDGIEIYVSTPTLKNGRIDTLFQRGDQRRYHVQCPHCGRWDWIAWSDRAHFYVAYDDQDPTTARLQCPEENHGGCGAALDETARRRMVAVGEWRATAIAKEPGLVSFHLPAMVTTLGKASLFVWVSDWLSAVAKGKESTRVFINTTLAEGWEDRGARMNPQLLLARREPYGEDVEVPDFAVVLTAGVDVQVDRFELQVIGWGPNDERAVVDYQVIPGDPKQADTRSQLLTALQRTYTHALGPQLPIRLTCIDSGWAADDIYGFVLAHGSAHNIRATKGIGNRSGNPIVMKATQQHTQSKRPIQLFPINTDDAKADIMGALTASWERLGASPGAIHFPRGRDTIHEEYFSQLCSEHRETVYNKLKIAVGQRWVQDRDRNEALDTAVLALAAYRMLNANLRQMRQAIVDRAAREQPMPAAASIGEASASGRTVAPAVSPAVAPTPARQSRRSAPSKYLG